MILSIAFNLFDPEHSPLTRCVLVAGYLTAALCWLNAGLRARTARDRSSARWWMTGAFLFFFLATNKAFDWRSQCEMYIRMMANAGGWYEQREPGAIFFGQSSFRFWQRAFHPRGVVVDQGAPILSAIIHSQ